MKTDHFKPLPWTKLKRNASCYLPKTTVHAPVNANLPALEVMIDFRRVAPVTISRDVSIDDTNKVMTLCNTRFLLVVDAQGQLLGLVTEAGTKGHRPLAIAYAMGIHPKELVVGDVMINKHDDVEVVHLRDVTHAKVGNILNTLKELSTPFCLVVDHDAEDNHILCGMFSLSQIEHCMGIESQPLKAAKTFSEIVNPP